jgi:uncharacterized metal-binding protein YceD (DUF177 family)
MEFSSLLPLDRIGELELVETISAGADERAALARRFGLLSLERLGGEVSVRRCGNGDRIRVSGRFEAEVTQRCVVTLEPVTSRLADSFSQLYTAGLGEAEDAEAGDREVLIEPEQEDPPEPAEPGGIDLGELMAQQLAVAFDPYPRAPGAELSHGAHDPGAREDAEPAGGESPFSVLKALKRGD